MIILYIILIFAGTTAGVIFALPSLLLFLFKKSPENLLTRRIYSFSLAMLTFIFMFPTFAVITNMVTILSCYEAPVDQYCGTYINFENEEMARQFSYDVNMRLLIPVNQRLSFCFSNFETVCETTNSFMMNAHGWSSYAALALSTTIAILCSYKLSMYFMRNRRKINIIK